MQTDIQHYIAYEKVRLSSMYRVLAPARWELHQWEYAHPNSVLGIIELMTDHVMGAAEQVAIYGAVKNYMKVGQLLKSIQPFMLDYLLQWYLDDQSPTSALKAYVKDIDHLRFQLIEILDSNFKYGSSG